MKNLLILFIFLFSIQPSFLLSQTHCRISGQVTDLESGQPLYFANIFLSNTTIGCASDKDGNYLIENVPPGHYDLVATMIGHEHQKRSIQVFYAKDMTVHFSLKIKVLKGEKVSITGEIPEEWKKNLEIFKKLFFGVKKFADKCKIQNPEVLDLNYHKKSGQFRAFAEEPMIFTNNALGYKITLVIEEFNAELY